MSLMYPVMIGVAAAALEALLLGRGQRSRVTTVLIVVGAVLLPHPVGGILTNLFVPLVARRITNFVLAFQAKRTERDDAAEAV